MVEVPVSRRRLLAAGFGAAVSSAAGAGVYGFLIEPKLLDVTRHEMAMPLLPQGLDGLRVAVFGDLHFDPRKDVDLMEKLVAAVNREKPDLILIVGDYIEHSPDVIAPLLEHLSRLKAAHGIYAVMGNHDGWNIPPDQVSRLFRAVGIEFLVNEHSMIKVRGESLAIAGLDSVWSGTPDPSSAFKGIPPQVPTFALMHEPDYFDTLIEGRDSVLQVSGHTHGGQCRVPLIGYAPRRVSYGKKYLYGEYSRDESRLLVTRGVGTTGIRVRFACWPELVMLTVRSGQAG